MIDRLTGPRQFFWFHYFDLHAPYGDAAGTQDEISLSEVYDRIKRHDPNVKSFVELAKLQYLEDARVLDRRLDQLLQRLAQDAEEVDTHVLVVASPRVRRLSRPTPAC